MCVFFSSLRVTCTVFLKRAEGRDIRQGNAHKRERVPMMEPPELVVEKGAQYELNLRAKMSSCTHAPPERQETCGRGEFHFNSKCIYNTFWTTYDFCVCFTCATAFNNGYDEVFFLKVIWFNIALLGLNSLLNKLNILADHIYLYGVCNYSVCLLFFNVWRSHINLCCF